MPHKKINKLTLLEREVNGKQAVWKCRCDCGREKKFSEELLFSGVIPSCGIKHCGQIHLPEGMKIGKLTTVRQTGGSGSASSLWLCCCECGKERTVYQRYLLDGTVTSCGCERSGLYPGLRIGRLTLQSAFRDGERKKWLCRCDCGKEVAVFPSALHSGKTQSCGCFGLQAGDRFGKLVILRQMDSGRFLCRCDCGKEKQFFARSLADSSVQSCGCDSVIHPGDQFSRWTAVEPKGISFWLCRCTCGSERVVRSSDLLSGKSRSCGCLRHLPLPAGQRFGQLTVIEDRGCLDVLCRCDCGTEKVFSRAGLRRGTSVSCGCTGKRKKRRTVSEGERFGRLTVVRMASPGSVVCRCDCGQEKEYPIDNLLRDRVHSCGCAKGRRPSVRVGKRYGNLTVLELGDNGHCVCQCDCGNTTEVLKEDLTAGKVTSCGCLEEQPEPFVAFG